MNTATIDRAAMALIRSLDGTTRAHLDCDRDRLGMTEIVDCDGCKDGLAERLASDYDPEYGTEYMPVHGSSVDPDDENVWYCASCTAAGVRAPVPVV